MSDIAIRKAELEDTDWILRQLREFSKFIETRRPLYGSEEYSRDGIKLLIEKHVFFIAEQNSSPIGFIAGFFTPHLFNPEILILCELFFYTLPEFRKTRAAYLLFKEYEKYGEQHAQWITMSLNRFTAINENSILRRGYHLHEKTYLREL